MRQDTSCSEEGGPLPVWSPHPPAALTWMACFLPLKRGICRQDWVQLYAGCSVAHVQGGKLVNQEQSSKAVGRGEEPSPSTLEPMQGG